MTSLICRCISEVHCAAAVLHERRLAMVSSAWLGNLRGHGAADWGRASDHQMTQRLATTYHSFLPTREHAEAQILPKAEAVFR